MASPEELPASLTAFTHGDRVAAQQLAKALEAIRDHVEDPSVARSARQVLDGRRSLREVTREPGFLAALGAGMDQFARQWAALSPEERVALAEQGKQQTEAMSREIGLPGEVDPAEVGDFGPARTDPDTGDGTEPGRS